MTPFVLNVNRRCTFSNIVQSIHSHCAVLEMLYVNSSLLSPIIACLGTPNNVVQCVSNVDVHLLLSHDNYATSSTCVNKRIDIESQISPTNTRFPAIGSQDRELFIEHGSFADTPISAHDDLFQENRAITSQISPTNTMFPGMPITIQSTQYYSNTTNQK